MGANLDKLGFFSQALVNKPVLSTKEEKMLKKLDEKTVMARLAWFLAVIGSGSFLVLLVLCWAEARKHLTLIGILGVIAVACIGSAVILDEAADRPASKSK
jgi:hypothetical protein